MTTTPDLQPYIDNAKENKRTLYVWEEDGKLVSSPYFMKVPLWTIEHYYVITPHAGAMRLKGAEES